LNGLGRPRRHVIEDYLLVDQQPVIAAVELRAGRLTTLMPSQRVNSFSAKKLFCDPGSLIGLIGRRAAGTPRCFAVSSTAERCYIRGLRPVFYPGK